MNVSNQEQKQARLKQFLKILSEDPFLSSQEGQEESRSLSELCMLSGYLPRSKAVNMAELVSMLLRKIGYDACSDDMMEFIMNGGTIVDFMNTGRQEQL
jgi:hypothetical protein